MSELRFVARLLVLAIACAMPVAHAENSLQGLEMDVMEPGESAAQATARIMLPRPGNGLDTAAGYTGLDAEQSIRSGLPLAADVPAFGSAEVADPGAEPAEGAAKGESPEVIGITPAEPGGN